MSNLKPLLERNTAFALTGAHDGLTPVPRHQVVVVTCMDGRVDPSHILGVELGDAIVIRNSGGRVTEDVLRSISFIATLTETMFGDDAQPFEVAVLQHTGCGSGLLVDADFRAALSARTGADESVLLEAAVTDPTVSARRDVEVLMGSPLVPDTTSVSGHVYDVGTGVITTVVEVMR